MFGKVYKAGISVSGDQAQIAVLQFRGDDISLVHLAEIENDHQGEHWFLRPLLTKPEKIYKKVSAVSIAFDNASVVYHLFPIDTSLSREEQHEQTQWEMAQFIPGFSPKEYLIDVHTMKIRAKDHLAEMFVVAARRSALMDVQSTLGERRLGLEIADISFFGGQYALMVNYPETRSKSIAVVEIGTSRIDMGVLSFSRLSSFGYALQSSPSDCVAEIGAFLAQQRVTELYLYGTGLSLQMQEAVAKDVKIPLVRIDPFRRMQVGKSAPGFEAISGNEHRYASAVGVALRKQ